MLVKGDTKVKLLDGFLSVKKIFSDGTEEKILDEDPNLIMLQSKLNMLSTIYQGSFTPDPISTLQVGIGGTIDPAGLYPQTVTPNRTSLFNSSLSVSVSYTVNSSVPSVTFLANLDQSTGNGLLITEAGLFTVGNNMFNQKTFPGIPKTSEFSLQFSWTIKLS